MTVTASRRYWGHVGSTSQSKILVGIPTTELIGIIWFSTLFILEIGIKNGELNQVFYLLHGLRRADSTFLQGDWLTSNSVPYHVPWDFIVAVFARAGLLEVGLTTGTVIMTSVFCVAVYAGMKSLYERPLLPWALTLMLFAGLLTRGLGDMNLLPSSIEPYGIGGTAMVVGFAFLAWQRPLGAGISWGVGALMHSHFALLIAGILVLTTLVQVRRVSAMYLLKIWVPYVLLAAPSLLRVYTFASAPGGAEMYKIYSDVASQHYYPWREDIKPFALFGGVGLMGISGLLLRRPRWNPNLFVPVAAVALIVIASLIASYLDWFDFVRRALPWRLSSFLVLVGVASGAAALGDCREWRLLDGGIAAMFALLVAFGVFLLAGTSRLWLSVLTACTVLFARVSIHHLAARHLKYRSALTLVPFLVVTIGMFPIAYKEVAKSHLNIRPIDATRSDLYAWVRSQTAPGSVFVVPPGWKDFRLNAQRPVVAEWSGVPLYPSDFFQWYQRFRDLTGLERPHRLQDAESGYKQLDCQRADFLHRRYSVQYFAIEQGHALPCGTVVYSDNYYQVINYMR